MIHRRRQRLTEPDHVARTDRRPVYPVFLPHAGCPFQCVYCDQASIAGVEDASGGIDLAHIAGKVDELAEAALKAGRPGEIAFFGGTFTGLESGIMCRVLDGAARHVARGVFTGIRFSTRPDAIGPDVLELLNAYPVRTVELGVQSLDDSVLAESGRGYTCDQVVDAASSLRKMKWDVGLQFMPGLPGDDRSRFLESIRKGLALGPAFIRIYPTLVLAGTPLAARYRRGLYRPLDLEEAVSWCAEALRLCLDAGVPVARLGLLNEVELERKGAVLAGPVHPSFGYLVRCRWWRDRIDEALGNPVAQPREFPGNVTLRVPARAVSEAVGHGRENINSWRQRRGIDIIHVKPDPALAPWSFTIQRD